jgi:hypothetical protein
MAERPVPNKINIGVIFVGWPMALEVVEEGRPVGPQAMGLKIAQREGEAVVDTDQRRLILGQALNEPFRDGAPGPVFLWRGRGRTSVGAASPTAM